LNYFITTERLRPRGKIQKTSYPRRGTKRTNWEKTSGTDGYLVRQTAKGELNLEHADTVSLILMGDPAPRGTGRLFLEFPFFHFTFALAQPASGVERFGGRTFRLFFFFWLTAMD
jgi:hypothetical protein